MQLGARGGSTVCDQDLHNIQALRETWPFESSEVMQRAMGMEPTSEAGRLI